MEAFPARQVPYRSPITIALSTRRTPKHVGDEMYTMWRLYSGLQPDPIWCAFFEGGKGACCLLISCSCPLLYPTGLQDNISVRHFDLGGCRLGARAILDLGNMIRYNNTVTSIHLGGNSNINSKAMTWLSDIAARRQTPCELT